ncbi:Eco57I restriction-modification methylase domain-containing protein [Actinomadura sp. 3N407]|uniref:Eco57I restriction-modification methylase domain-containing protein n=1 Tax=Actinomadura sp. 3N407 TaxID=3457423 RepID=UPI003FCE96AA
MIGITGFSGLTWRDAVAQSRPGESELWAAGQQLVKQLARKLGEQAAVGWVHTGAVLSHAGLYGLIPSVPLDDAAAIRKQCELLSSTHPALAGFADPDVNSMWTAGLDDADAAMIGRLFDAHTVADLPAVPDGYRIGNLYQQLSVDARKNRALCQTPQCVTDLLLQLSLDHAVDEAGWDQLPTLNMIDPACGTGHILVEAFLRIEAWRSLHPKAPRRQDSLDRVVAALTQVHGVDLDPYAALIARYRLCALAAAMTGGRFCDLPHDLPVQVVAADALLDDSSPLLKRSSYDVAIANPPYITCKDATTRAAIRSKYPNTCYQKFPLALPFHELMVELLRPGGWCAQLTANSFMKREFGKPYIEKFLHGLDLRWVIDTSGAYIPGHGTPTVILVTRNRPSREDEPVFSIQGIAGEPRVPEHVARGIVISQIRNLVRERDVAARVDALLDGSHSTSTSSVNSRTPS